VKFVLQDLGGDLHSRREVWQSYVHLTHHYLSVPKKAKNFTTMLEIHTWV
jgi:hypothetical protein